MIEIQILKNAQDSLKLIPQLLEKVKLEKLAKLEDILKEVGTTKPTHYKYMKSVETIPFNLAIKYFKVLSKILNP